MLAAWHDDDDDDGVTQVWIQGFPSLRLVAIQKLKEHSLPNYLKITEGRIVGNISFFSLFAPGEMQTASSRLWTWVTVSIKARVP